MIRRSSLAPVAIAVALLASACGSTVPLSQRTAAGLTSAGEQIDSAATAERKNGQTNATGRVSGASSTRGNTSAAVSSATGQGTPSSGGSGPARARQVKGRGFDAKNVYVGVSTMKDFDTAVHTLLGANGFDSGDAEADAKAMAAYLNKHGGVLGRKVVLRFHDTKFADAQRDPAGSAQALCEDFTQDRPVAAVIDTTISDGYTLWDCWKKAGLPIFSGWFNMTDQSELNRYFPYRYAMANNRIDSYFPTLLNRQQALGYFKPWDNVNGRPGAAPVKVGLMYVECVPADGRAFAQLTRLLKARRITVAATAGVCSDPSAINGAILKFKTEGVTHVYMDYAAQGLLFMQGAENQRYRPRYAAWSHLSPGTLEQIGAPPEQFRGMLGAGFHPSTDVSPANNPGDVSSAGPLCRRILQESEVQYARYSTAEYVGFVYCDAFRLLAAATNAGGSFFAQSVRRGFGTIASKFQSATVFRNGFSASRSDASSAIRDFGWVSSCSCLKYLSRTNHAS